MTNKSASWEAMWHLRLDTNNDVSLDHFCLLWWFDNGNIKHVYLYQTRNSMGWSQCHYAMKVVDREVILVSFFYWVLSH